jgi:ectoine hydroxylase-related dioxygenase (phytanoyl-CoA dioxygenase family)
MRIAAGDLAPVSADDLRRLNDDGYLVVADVLGARVLDALRERVDELFKLEGEAAGREFRHLVLPDDRAGAHYLGDLLAKDNVFRACLDAPRVVAIVRHLLGDEIAVHAMNARNPRASGGQQVWHPHPGLVNTLWLLDDMRLDNGPTRVLPGSHRQPVSLNADGLASHPDEQLITATAGDVIVLADRVLHGGTTNTSGRARRVVTTAFSRPDVPPQYPVGRRRRRGASAAPTRSPDGTPHVPGRCGGLG